MTAICTYNNEDAGTGKTVNITYTLTGADAGNYARPGDTIIYNGVITPKQLSAGATIVNGNKRYDAKTTCEISILDDLLGKIGSDEVALSATASYVDKNAGYPKPVTVTYSIAGTDAANYIAPANYSTTSSMEKRNLTVDISVPISKNYDGTTNVPVTHTVDGFVTGDDVAINISCNTPSPEKGSCFITQAMPTVTFTGIDAGNYNTQYQVYQQNFYIN